MDTRIRWIGVAFVASTVVAVPLAAASAQSPVPRGSGDPLGRFTAHLRGSQTEHSSDLVNISYDPPGKHCKPGLRSDSTDQQMTFESEPVEVEVVRLPPGAIGWSGQEYLLVPQAIDEFMLDELVTYGAPESDIMMAPVLFELPVRVTIDRANAEPATGAGPAEPLPLTVACTGGDRGGETPPPPDCGERTSTTTMAIVQPQVNVALATASESAFWEETEPLYERCPVDLEVIPGAFAWDSLHPPTITGGPLPTLEQLLDPDLMAVDIIGQVSGGYEEPGSLNSQAMEWTLTLCREGATAPNC